jgi:hypothetical protein
MKKNVISREKLLSFNGIDIYLTINEGEEPLIETEPGVISPIGNQISLSSLFQIVPIDQSISQLVGDGPYTETISKEQVIIAANEALKRIDTRIGQLKIVWVPDDGIPF